MAVGAGVKTFHHDFALVNGNVADLPFDFRQGRLRQRFDDAAFTLFWRRKQQWDIAKEDGRADRITRSPNSDLALRNGFCCVLAGEPPYRHRGGPAHGMLLDGFPELGFGTPAARR